MAPALDENGLARLTLREIAREHGPSGLDSPQLLNTLLPDLLPGAPRENRLIVAAAQLGVAGLLTSRMSLGLPVTTAIGDIAARLADETALDAEAARWVVTEYAYVLGHGPDPRTAVDAAAAGQPVSGAVPPRPRPDSDPAPTSPGIPVSPAGIPVASPGAPPFPPPVAPTAVMPPAGPARNRRGLIIAASVVTVLVVASAIVYGLTKSPPKKSHGSPGSTTPAPPCVVGTWNLTGGFLRVDGSGNPTDDDSGTKLTPTSGTETRVFDADGTGTISLSDINLEGDSSDGHHLLFYFNATSDGTFDWVWDGSTVTYSNVVLPGEVRVDVDGSTVADNTHVDPLYDNGDANLSCDGDSLVQTGTGYERDYSRG